MNYSPQEALPKETMLHARFRFRDSAGVPSDPREAKQIIIFGAGAAGARGGGTAGSGDRADRKSLLAYPEECRSGLAIELSVTEKCTLRCRNRGNLMPYYDEPEHLPTTVLTRDLDIAASTLKETPCGFPLIR